MKQKCPWFDKILSFWTLVVQPVTNVLWNDNYVADFGSRVAEIYQIRVPDAHTDCTDVSEW